MELKDSLLMLVAATREKEAADLVPHVDDSPPDAGRWTAKDNLAHMSAWRDHAAGVLEAVCSGGPAPHFVDDLVVENAKIYTATHDLPARTVLEEARRSWERLKSAIEACSADDLTGPRPGRPDQQAWEVIPGDTHFHLAEHLGYWSSERGHEEAAEKAAIWAHDLNNDAFSGPVQRGYADYNLGCYFARHGRADDALPYLRNGIELVPRLKEWAKEDTDLDPIRGSPELTALLG